MNKFTFRWLISAVNIRTNSDKEYAVVTLKESIHMRGPNLWYLVSSAILASIGLDTNSPAVIIGAMLISPLMSPILGIGLSIGIYDKELLISSMKEFVFAVFLSLFISTLYFLLSPLGSATHELVARTTPTMLDIGVALFGGIAGIVAGTRRGIATSIPGVAIATALMPPICTAGFGIANGNPYFFGGAFYLFFINAVFIALSAILIVRYLKFPTKKYVDKALKSRIQRVISLFVLVVSVPSAIIFLGIIRDANEQKKLKTIITQNFDDRNRSVLNWKLIKSDTTKILRIFYTGDVYTEPGRKIRFSSFSKQISAL
ncbi:MAG: TIGR00341 family protein [Candidatus Kapaibacterium sp.]